MGCGPYGNGWCLGGEIDILEHVNERRTVIGNVHYGGRKDASWLDCKQSIGEKCGGGGQPRGLQGASCRQETARM